MKGSTNWLRWILPAVVVALSRQLTAEPIDQAAVEAVTKGWLADEHSHLAAKIHSRIKSIENFTNFYVVHLEPEGYVVTPADDELEPVLAFSEQGDFKPDAENPLWLMLSRDVPARTEHLRKTKGRHANGFIANALAPGATTNAEDAVIVISQKAKAKWEKYKNHVSPEQATSSLASANAPTPPSGTNSNMVASALDGDATTNDIPAAPVHILGMQIVNDHVQLTHDAAGSVTIYASYDYGQTWQVADSGVVWPTWTAKQSVMESSCWYRIAPDNIYDAMTVSLMRSPPPLAELPDLMTNANASDPGSSPGLVGSKGAISDVRVSPLVQSYWDQGTAAGQNCYNYFTPNNYVDGCVATVLAQLMRYWQFPTARIGQITRTIYVNGQSRSGITRGGDGIGGAYNWSQMPLSPATTTYNATQWQMIGALCYDAGVSVNMQYASGGSGAFMESCPAALTGVFQYANAKYVDNPGNLLIPTDANLAAGYPVLFGITASGNDGHAVVCDGFGYDSSTLYHHINFGWSGAYNAWYALPNLETPYGFNIIDTIVFNIFPTGTGELLTGRITTGQSAPVTGATVTASANGQNYVGTSDSKGYYGIKVPSAQTYSVTATKSGMGSVTRTGVVIGTSGPSASGNVIGADITLNNSFSFTAIGLTNSVWLRWTAPTNAGLPTNTVYIRARTDRYPTNSTDGNLVYTGTAQVYEHTGVDTSGSVTNYYTIWGNDGSAYASLGANVNGASVADPGTVRLLWTRSTGEVSTWNLKADGTHKSGGYATSGLLDMTYWKVCGFNDIDGDGVSDILWTGAGGEVVYWFLNADGTLRLAGRVYPGNATSSGYWTVAGFADIDRDGVADILWTGAGGEVVYWLLNADGTRKSAGRVAPGNATASGYWKVAGFADIDRDGTADILWTGNGGEVVYWLLNPNGTQRVAGRVAPGNATANNYWKVIGFNDIDRDGTADILWTGAGGELVYWLLNQNGTQKTAARVAPGNVTRTGYWTVAGFKDINHDHTSDLIWRGQGGETKYWFLNPDGSSSSTGNIDNAAVAPSVWTLHAVGSCGH